MGLGLNDTRSIILRLIAVDEASGTLNKVGTSLAGMSKSFKMFGAGIAFQQVGSQLSKMGEALLGVAESSVKMAISFEDGMARVQTQAQLGSADLARLSEGALQSAGRYGQGFETINQGLYDIFSSTELNGKKALDAVNQFARAASAGGTDVRTAARAAIAEMNAMGKGSSSLEYILDNQFQAVRKGVFTYEEFASSVGNMLPYAASADQSLKTLTGSMAFLSRQGFTASQSAISVARALDSLMRKRPEMKDVLGIDIVDKATGDYKSLSNIMGEMANKMKGFSGPQIQKALSDIFGAGEIRANRFFRLAIPRQDQLNKMIGQMGGDQVAGQAKKAWDIMKQTPAVQWQIFIEKGRALLVMFGQELLPIFLSVVKVLQDIVKWFQNLSPETKKWIGYIVLAAGIILTVTGALFQMIGAILLVGSALVFTEVGIGVFLTTAGIILGVVAAIVIAGILIWRNWDKVKPVLITIWDALKTAFFTTWNAIKAVAIAVWDWVYAYLVTPFVTLIKLYISIWAAIFETVYAAVMKIWDVIRTVFTAIWGVIGPILGFIWELVKRVFTDIWETITFVAAVLIAVWQGLWAIYWGVAKSILAVLWALIKTAFQVGFKIIEGILKASWAWWMIYWHAIVAVWHTVGEPIIKAIGFVWHNVFYPIVKWVMETLGRAWRTFWDLIKSYWEVIGRPVFDAIKTAFKAVWDFLVNGFKFISDHWAGFWEGVKSIFFGIINSILAGIEGFVNGIISAINWVRTKFGLSPMGNVVLSRVGETGGGGGAPTGGKAGGRLAKGTDYWRGGWAWVGERGPELAYLPRGSAVIPNTLSMGINMANNTPGFAGGFLSGTVVNRALSAVGVRMPALPGVFQDLGPAIFDQVTDWFKNGIKYILGGGTSAHSGGVVRQSGMAYIQQGERIQSARVARNVWGSGGGGEIHIHIEPQKAVIDEHELIAEVDWARRTRRW